MIKPKSSSGKEREREKDDNVFESAHATDA